MLLDRVVRSASKTIGSTLPTVGELYETYMMKKRDILKDTSHPLHEFYYVEQSGCRYISERIVLYCIVLYCIVLYCIVLYCIVLYCIVLYCIVLYCIVLYCIVLYRTASVMLTT